MMPPKFGGPFVKMVVILVVFTASVTALVVWVATK